MGFHLPIHCISLQKKVHLAYGSTFLTASLRKHLFGLFWFSQVIFFLVLITLSHTAFGVLVVMYYCMAAFTVNKMLHEGKTGKYHINVTELYLFGFFSPLNHKQSCTIFFYKCPDSFTSTAQGNCATKGTRQILKHAKKGLWLWHCISKTSMSH